MKTHSISEDQLLSDREKHPAFALRREMGEFIAQWPWEWFVTFTFKYDVHQERALKLYRVWVSMLNRHLFGRRWHKKPPHGVAHVVAIEFQKSGRVHLHALIMHVHDTRRLDWMDYWMALDDVAGFPRIEAVSNINAASGYVSKHIAKGGEIEFSENLRFANKELFPEASSV